MTRAFARWAKQTGALRRGVLISAANPGLTLTDATRDFMGTVFKRKDAQAHEEAARDLHWLPTLPDGAAEPSGELVGYRRVIPLGY